MSRSNGNMRAAGSFLIGSLTGVALGILFAPDKGRKTRHKIATGAKEWTGTVEEYASDKITEWTDTLKNKAENLKSRFAMHGGNHHPVEETD